jgi:flagellar hook-associated protein 1 FlgK
VTINPPAATPNVFQQINVGDVLTIDAGTPAQENVTVTAVNRNTGTISFVAKNAHLVANYSITSAQTTTLQQNYANLVARVGQDTAAATTGSAAQTTLTTNINQVRQSTDGINIDEETQNLVKFQNAYGAAAHVISTLSAMLSDAINLGGGSF